MFTAITSQPVFVGPSYDWLFAGTLALHLVLLVLGMKAMARVRPYSEAGFTELAWTLIMLFIPVIGPSLFLILTSADKKANSSHNARD